MSRAAVLFLALLPSLALGQFAPPPEPTPPTQTKPADALIRLPELLDFQEATYPPEALAEGVEADVLLQLDVDADGGVTAVEVLEPVGLYGFDEAAVEAARAFRFRPAESASGPVPVRIQYRYSFTIDAPPPPPPTPASVVTIRGRLLERGTRAPVAAIPVTVPAVGAVAISDDEGRFELLDVPPGPATLLVPPTQYAETSEEVEVPSDGAAEITLYLQRDPYASFRTIIQAEELSPQPARRQLAVEEIQKMPGVSGDALKAVQNLPGVARPPFGGGQIVMRGSAPEDTIYRVDGLELPQLYHFGGIYSVFNTDLVESLDTYPGGFSVAHGDGTAGLIDVRLKKGRTDRWGGYFDINVFHAAGYASGPVWEGGSLTLAARRSYIDAILPAVIPDDSKVSFNTAPVYYDYQVKLDTALGPDDDLRVFVFGSDDQLRILLSEPSDGSPLVRGNVTNHFLFHHVHGRWTHRFDRDTTLDTSLLVGTQQLSFDLGKAIDFYIYAGDLSWRFDLTSRLTPHLTLRAGMDSTLTAFRVAITAPLPPKEGATPSPLGTTETRESNEEGTYLRNALYLEAVGEPTDGLELTAGLRADVYTGAFEDVTFDPRVSARWKVGETTTLKGGLGMYHRQPAPDETSEAFGNPEITAEQSIQYSVGVEQEIFEGLTVDVQAFYKDLSNLVAPATDSFGGPPLTNEGSGRVYGGEILVRQQLGKWFWGWVAYTVSRSERKDAATQPIRLFDFDQTHVLTAVASFTLPLEFQVGARFRYATGNPQTPVVGAVFDADTGSYTQVAGAPATARLGDFHQLDLRVDKTWTFEDWVLDTYLEVQNVYNQQNPEGTRYNYNFRQSEPVSGLPIIPGFGIKGTF
ncbi:MAG: TonB-dependent receptor [Myxococcales bacterium]